jgi:hypothetical protein
MSQAAVRLCGTGGLRRAPAGALRPESKVLPTRPLCEAGCNLLCAEDQILLVPLAQFLPQNVRSPYHRGLRYAGLLRRRLPGRPTRSLATDLGSALSRLPLTRPVSCSSARALPELD